MPLKKSQEWEIKKNQIQTNKKILTHQLSQNLRQKILGEISIAL